MRQVADHTFSIRFLGHVFHTQLAYPNDFHALAAEVRRVLKPGGRFVTRVFVRPQRPEPLAEIAGYEAYAGLATRCYLPTLPELRAIHGPVLREADCRTGDYEQAATCPTLVLERVEPAHGAGGPVSRPRDARRGAFRAPGGQQPGPGHVYCALARVLRPSRMVVIGSYRGFVPIVLARAIADNLEPAELDFVDPSLVDDFWRDAAAVQAHFARFTTQRIRHHLMTTQQFVVSPAYAALKDVGLLFVDGYHSYEQARFDFEAFVPTLADNAVMLFHDSVRVRVSRTYGARSTRSSRAGRACWTAPA